MSNIDRYSRIAKTSINLSTKKTNAIDYLNEDKKWLKNVFWGIYVDVLSRRGVDKTNIVKKTGKKELDVISILFEWAICSSDFKYDLRKGIFIASNQGFGKDVLLLTVTMFFKYFWKGFKEYTFNEFNLDWYNKSYSHFNMPLRINDITGKGRIKKDRESIPFLEMLDYREQTNNRRGLLLSSNFTPEELQSMLEYDIERPRLKERLIECCNIVLVKDVTSKREESLICI